MSDTIIPPVKRIKIWDGTNTAGINIDHEILVIEHWSPNIYTKLEAIALFCSQTPSIKQIDKAAVDGWIIDSSPSLTIYWMTITNTGTNATEFKLWDETVENILYHLKINPGETLDFRWFKYLIGTNTPIWYDYIAGDDPAISFTIGYYNA